ncbi:MAG TPA: type II secretion system F family protein [Candidatus Eisenbacteria bacterium]|nr:type II secretion system F family protein [Candidatus Eisenbacteria bacterium]
MATLAQRVNEWLVYNSSVPLTTKVFFTENLKVMVHAGLSISEGLNTLALQAESKNFKRVITIVREDVEQGKTLSAGLAKFPKIFPPIFTSMIQIGEVSGTLEDVLLELTTQMKKDYELRSKVKGAMTYPVVVLVAMLGITTGLLTFVLPKLLGVFKEFGNVKLPLATRILITISDFTQNHGLLVAVGFVVFVVGFIAFSRTKVGRSIIHRGIIFSPIIGPIAKKVNLARFSRTVSGLLKTDIPVVQSFHVTSQVLANVHYSAAVQDAAERIKKGETIARSLGAYPKLFPPLVVQMVLVGERSGTVDELLSDIATFYEQQVDQILDNLSSVIEPILILSLGGMVGGIALAVITPIYALTQSIAESN